MRSTADDTHDDTQYPRLGLRTLGDPEVSSEVLSAFLAIFGAKDGRVYSIDLSKGHFVSTAKDSRSGDTASIDARRLRASSGWGPLEGAASERRVQILPSPSVWQSRSAKHVFPSRAVFPVLRKATVVGLIDLHGDHLGQFDSLKVGPAPEKARLAMIQLGNSHEARSVHRILERTARFKVALNEHESIFLENLMRFVGESSGMQYAALRRLEADGSLNCIKTYGFPNGIETSLTLADLAQRYQPFAAVVEEHDHWIAESLEDPIYDALRNRPELNDIRSFVACPVLIGESLWGVLSFAAAIEYDYSDLEVYSLRALANLAGVALDAAKSSDSAAEAQYDDGRLMQAVLSNEVVVATRHEMYDQLAIIGDARSILDELLRPLSDPNRGTRLSKSDIELLQLQVKHLDLAHSQMNKVMETIRFSQSELKPAREPVSINEVWLRAKEPFAFRLNRARVPRVANDVPISLRVVGSFDWLRIVFMHLVLNSLDAFDRNLDKGRREIGIRLEDESADRVRIRYHDTGGGIQPNSLMRRGDRLSGDIKHLIFDRYVTSKARGTGLGLASCRAALATMDGSIELVDWRRGITFDLVLNEWQGA